MEFYTSICFTPACSKTETPLLASRCISPNPTRASSIHGTPHDFYRTDVTRVRIAQTVVGGHETFMPLARAADGFLGSILRIPIPGERNPHRLGTEGLVQYSPGVSHPPPHRMSRGKVAGMNPKELPESSITSTCPLLKMWA